MRKEQLQIKDKIIVIMEQPASFVLKLERTFGDEEVVNYCKQILMYPVDTNPEIESIISIPNKLQHKDLELDVTKNGKIDLYLIEKMFFALKERKSNTAYLGEFFIKLCNKNINDFKYRDLVEIGKIGRAHV